MRYSLSCLRMEGAEFRVLYRMATCYSPPQIQVNIYRRHTRIVGKLVGPASRASCAFVEFYNSPAFYSSLAFDPPDPLSAVAFFFDNFRSDFLRHPRSLYAK